MVTIFAQPGYQATQETHSYYFLHFWQRQMNCWYLNFAVQTHFTIIVSIMGRCSIQYAWYLYFSCLWCTSKCLIINIGVVNQFIGPFSKIHKSLISLKEIFHLQIRIHFITHDEERKQSYGPPGCSPCTIYKIGT